MRDRITERIRLKVFTKELTEGTKLREVALAEEFGVSRIPVRDALLQLTSEGLLVAKPNCGMRVAPLPGESVQPLIISLRRDIEKFALKRAMDRLDELDLGNLYQITDQYKKACKSEDPSEVLHCDMAFHRFIIKSSGEDQLVDMWLPMISRMLMNYSRHDKWMDSYEEHLAIANAISSGDHPRAEKLLLSNIQ